MDCIREAENYLRYYRELKKSIEHADRMITKLKYQTAPKGSGVAQMEPTGIRAGKPINTYNQIYQLQKWLEMKERTEVEIAKVDDILDAICMDPGCERYKDILVMWYAEKIRKEDIAVIMGYSHRQSIYEIKNKAIRKFAVCMFGIEALEAI